mmetsp:Transcript_10117/g.15449  ORF Transcript_10117/g.15449 Transcript_10117/m.15449 type:complete len:97 (-) Transcript_10117:879-1169(-)
MIVAAFMPYALFLIEYLLKKIARLQDRCMAKGGSKTSQATAQQFIELYSGPEVLIHFRYAAVMTQVFVTFTYGLALPILFPICLLAMVNTFVMEKL